MQRVCVAFKELSAEVLNAEKVTSSFGEKLCFIAEQMNSSYFFYLRISYFLTAVVSSRIYGGFLLVRL